MWLGPALVVVAGLAGAFYFQWNWWNFERMQGVPGRGDAAWFLWVREGSSRRDPVVSRTPGGPRLEGVWETYSGIGGASLSGRPTKFRRSAPRARMSVTMRLTRGSVWFASAGVKTRRVMSGAWVVRFAR